MNVILYSTHCPKCSVLETKLNNANIEFDLHDDMDELMALGYLSVPVLNVDGKVMLFKDACDWVNEVGSN